MQVREFIEKYYPAYYSLEHYPSDRIACITKTSAPWGVLGNFAATPLTIDSVVFPTAEHLFHIMKFTDTAIRKEILRAAGMPLKWKSKKYESEGMRRSDWGERIVDAMKFCLVRKYEQSEAFRRELERSCGLFIIEDETSRRRGKPADSWGAVLSTDKSEYVGPNLLGRLLMELRDGGGKLTYSLPEEMTDFSDMIAGK